MLAWVSSSSCHRRGPSFVIIGTTHCPQVIVYHSVVVRSSFVVRRLVVVRYLVVVRRLVVVWSSFVVHRLVVIRRSVIVRCLVVIHHSPLFGCRLSFGRRLSFGLRSLLVPPVVAEPHPHGRWVFVSLLVFGMGGGIITPVVCRME